MSDDQPVPEAPKVKRPEAPYNWCMFPGREKSYRECIGPKCRAWNSVIGKGDESKGECSIVLISSTLFKISTKGGGQ